MLHNAKQRAEQRRQILKCFTDGFAPDRHEYLTVRLPFALYHRVTSFAGDHGLKRSEAARRLLERGLVS
jgi:hypothetical protein